jgi:hypothetical protein
MASPIVMFTSLKGIFFLESIKNHCHLNDDFESANIFKLPIKSFVST